MKNYIKMGLMAVGFLFAACGKDKPDIFPNDGFYGNLKFFKYDLNDTTLRFSDFGITVKNNYITDYFKANSKGTEVISYNEDKLLSNIRVLENDNQHITVELNIDTLGYDHEVNGKKVHETLHPFGANNGVGKTTATLHWNTVANGRGLTLAQELEYLKEAVHSNNGQPQTLIPRPSPFK